MKILILGGAGYIGSVLTEYLKNQGEEVTVFDDFLYGDQEFEGVKVIKANITNLNELIPAIEKADAVVHLAGLSNDPTADLKPELTWQMNWKINQDIADLLKNTGKRLVFASSCSVYGFSEDDVFDEKSQLKPVTLYARTKMLSEKVFLQDGIDSIILRFATVYGYSSNPRLDLVVNTMIASGYFENKIVINGGEQWRPVVHVQDVTRAIYLALTLPPDLPDVIYNVGSNAQNYQIQTLGELIHQELPETELVVNDVSTDKRSYQVNFDLISQVLGFKAQFNVKNAITELYEAFQNGAIKNVQDDKYFRIKYLGKHLT